MWDLTTIIKINEIASELASEGKNPSAAIHELSKRRSKARRQADQESQARKERYLDRQDPSRVATRERVPRRRE